MNVWINSIINLIPGFYGIYYLSYKLFNKNKIKPLPGLIFFFIWINVNCASIALFSRLGL